MLGPIVRALLLSGLIRRSTERYQTTGCFPLISRSSSSTMSISDLRSSRHPIICQSPNRPPVPPDESILGLAFKVLVAGEQECAG